MGNVRVISPVRHGSAVGYVVSRTTRFKDGRTDFRFSTCSSSGMTLFTTELVKAVVYDTRKRAYAILTNEAANSRMYNKPPNEVILWTRYKIHKCFYNLRTRVASKLCKPPIDYFLTNL